MNNRSLDSLCAAPSPPRSVVLLSQNRSAISFNLDQDFKIKLKPDEA